MDIGLLLTGVAIGLSVTAPLGPVNLLVIRDAIGRGFGVAFLVGLGAVLADAAYAAVAAFGVSSVARQITEHARPLMAAGGGLLVVMGVRLARVRIGPADLALAAPPLKRHVAGKMLTAFGLTITNPGVFLGFLAIFGTLNGVLRLGEGWHRPPTVVAGVVLGGLLWWLVLSFAVSRFKARITQAGLGRVNRWTGVLIAAFGFVLLMQAVA